MDIPQLKGLAAYVRDLLQQANHRVSHSQSLDLIAALPGLRNWPEVQAFPDRVSACELDTSSAGRLAYRLKRKYELDLVPQDLLAALGPRHQMGKPRSIPHIWPTGPDPGVYVTTSQAAIDALVANYEEATDGALLYAESAASSAGGAIDLGEYGLWSSGLDRVPSGTLIVVGPIELAQDEWERSAERLQIAITHAGLCDHRVAVLAKTLVPTELCEDIRLLARTDEDDSNYCDPMLRGLVTDAGELVQRLPFAGSWPSLQPLRTPATPGAIPTNVRSLLEQALLARKSGLLIFGSDTRSEHWAAELVDAALALTEHAGPAARIIPKIRRTPSKDWEVPEATKQLPFLPSIESAYERGYRRMIINPHYIEGKVLQRFAGDVLFIAGTYDYEASAIAYTGIRGFASSNDGMELLTQVIALVGVVRVQTKSGVKPITDLFLGPGAFPPGTQRMKEIGDYIDQHRALKWEDEVRCLLNSGEVTAADLQSVHIRPSVLARFEELSGVPLAQSSDTL